MLTSRGKSTQEEAFSECNLLRMGEDLGYRARSKSVERSETRVLELKRINRKFDGYRSQIITDLCVCCIRLVSGGYEHEKQERQRDCWHCRSTRRSFEAQEQAPDPELLENISYQASKRERDIQGVSWTVSFSRVYTPKLHL